MRSLRHRHRLVQFQPTWQTRRPRAAYDTGTATPSNHTRTPETTMITLITCTGDRPQSFSLVEHCIRRQTYRGDLQWLVVNDGRHHYDYSAGQEVITRQPTNGPSLGANILAALPRVKGDRILFIEDDDWYAAEYLEVMNAALDKAPLVGNCPALYYNVQYRKSRAMTNAKHASLAQTGLRTDLIPILRRVIPGTPFIDMRLWRAWAGRPHSLFPNVKQPSGSFLQVSLKGMPGRPGLGVGHKDRGTPDPTGDTLREWAGPEAHLIEPYLGPA